MFTSVFQKKLMGKTAVSLFFALFVAALSFLGCPMESDTSSGNVGLNPKLLGTWEFIGPFGTERYIIGPKFTYSSDDGFGFTEHFSGTIVYAEDFGGGAGIIIIEYDAGHKQEWSSWVDSGVDGDGDGYNDWVETPLDPQPAGDFYGIYYVNLGDGTTGSQVFLANTSKLDDFSYGPTETVTLADAKTRFTEANINKYIDISVGEPQTKQ
jgi:hypothetical protein